MKRSAFLFFVAIVAMAFLTQSCSTPVSLTSWKNPETQAKVSKLLVMGVFDKMDVIQPVENQCQSFYNSKGLPTIKALDCMNPFQQYTKDQLKAKLDSLGADGFLLVTYKSTDVNVSSFNTGGFYGGYRGYWGGGSQIYIDKTYNFRAMLYTVKGDALMWSGDLAITDPNDNNSAALQMAQAMYNDWVAKGLLTNPAPTQTK